MQAEDFKNLGNADLAAGRYGEAVTRFTQAIAMNPDNHVFYSNRAAAYLRLEKASDALVDADKAISLNPSYAKAYSFRGAALEKLGNAKDALAAYRDGLTHDPNNATIRENIARLENTTSTATGTRTLKSVLFGTPAAKQSTIVNGIRAFMFLNLLMMLNPFNPYAAYTAFGRALLANAACQVYGLYTTYGRPQAAQQYAQQVMPDRRTFVLMLSVIFYMLGSPSLLTVLMLTGVDLFWFADFVYLIVQLSAPGLAPTLASLGMKVLPPASQPGFDAKPYRAKRDAVFAWLTPAIATLEIFVGISLLVSMDIMPLVVYGQLMKLRYLVSSDSQAAWRNAHATCLSYTQHPRCPGVVGVLYTKLAGFISWLGLPPTPPQQGAGGAAGGLAGLASKCTVM